MAINLLKGQTIDHRKNDRGDTTHDLSTVTIGLEWDIKKQRTLREPNHTNSFIEILKKYM